MAGVNDVVVAGGVQQMSMIPISSAMTLASRPRLRRPVHRLRGLGEALRRRRGQPVQQRRDDRREVGHLPRRHGGVRGREPRAGHPGPRRGPLRARDRPAQRRSPTTRVPASRTGRRSARCPTLVEGGRVTAAVAVADLRRVGRAAHRQRAGAEGPRPHPAGPHPPHERAGRRPDLHAHRPDPGHPLRVREDRHDDGRHRPRRDQRGVRLGGAGVGRRSSTSTMPRST